MNIAIAGASDIGFHLAKPYAVESTYWAPSKDHDFRYVITIKTSLVETESHGDKVTFDRDKAMASVDKAIGPQVHHFIENQSLMQPIAKK